MDRMMQLCADDGVIAHGIGLPLARNPFAKDRWMGWAWEMGWKEADFVAQNRAR